MARKRRGVSGPTVSYTNKFGINKYFTVGTYKEVQKRMDEFFEDSGGNEVCVYRIRRGHWGEWFENWFRVNGIPEIIKEGWM